MANTWTGLLILLIIHQSHGSFDCAVQLTVESQGVKDGNLNNFVRCGITYDLPDISIIDISISVSESCGNLDSYTQLANIDNRNNKPNIHSQTLASDVSGRIEEGDDTISYLTVTESNSVYTVQEVKCYRCDVQGVTSRDRTVTASNNVVHDFSKGLTCPNKEVALSLTDTSSTINVEDFSQKLDNISGCCHEQGYELQAVVNKLVELNATVDVQSNSIRIKLEEISTDMTSKSDQISRALGNYSNGDSLQSEVNEMKDLVYMLNGNLSNQINNVHGDIENEMRNVLTKFENNTEDIRKLGDQIAAADVKVEVNNMQDKMKVVDATVKGLNEKVGSLGTQVTGLDNKIGELDMAVKTLQTQMQTLSKEMGLLQKIDDRLETLAQAFWPTGFDESPFYLPSPSNVFRGKLYLLTKESKDFDITGANEVCRGYGGYLVELNDEEEFEFVDRLVKGKHHVFYIGYTDNNEEGKFVHVNSGRELPIDKWDIGEPNGGNIQNCIEMWKDNGGLHDIECGIDNRYICEVPYRF